MIDLDRLDIERACTRLINYYVQALDSGDYELAASCFTDTGTRSIGNRVAKGRDQILEAMRSMGTGRVSCHVVTNILIEVQNAKRALGSSVLLLWRREGVALGGGALPGTTPSLIARNHDEFVLMPDGWKFQSRSSQPLFRAADGPAAPRRAATGAAAAAPAAPARPAGPQAPLRRRP